MKGKMEFVLISIVSIITLPLGGVILAGFVLVVLGKVAVIIWLFSSSIASNFFYVAMESDTELSLMKPRTWLVVSIIIGTLGGWLFAFFDIRHLYQELKEKSKNKQLGCEEK